MKRYFEFSEGSSNKFWEVWCEGSEVFTRYGKIGASGQVTVKDMRSKDLAKQQHDKLVKEKTGKGYREKGAKKPAAKAAAKVPAASPVVATNPDEPRYADVPEGVVYLEGGTKKQPMFWQAKLDDKTLTVTTGALGTDGKTKKKKYDNSWSARGELNKQIENQLGNGFAYVLTGKPPKRPAVAAVNAQLEAQLRKDPSDDALAVYADWLQEQGDVRGELAALQAKQDKKLAKAAAKLLWEQRAYFYGPLAPYVLGTQDRERAIVDTWRAGWLDGLTLGATSGWGGSLRVSRVEDLLRVVPRVASAKFLRSLFLSRPRTDGEFQFDSGVAEIVKLLPQLPTVRRLTVGEFDMNESEISWSYMHAASKLWSVAQHLEYVKLRAGALTLGKIVLPEVREFRVETGGLDKGSLKSICEATWPKLETLSVWFGKVDYGCTCSIKGVQPILDGKGLGKLRHLGLKNSQFGDQIAAAIATSKIIRQLDTLDLSMSHITTEVIERDLLPHKAAFAKLSHLDLSRCLLDAKGQKLAKQLAKTVNLDRQRDWSEYADDPEYRYAAVGE